MSQRLIFRSNLLTCLLIVFSSSMLGCGPPPEPMGTLMGTVKSGGEICHDCRVALHSLKGSVGFTVGESGTYEFKNVPFGEYKISVYQKPTNAAVEVFDKRIPKKYRRAKTSGLTASISSEEPFVLDIEMN